MTKKERNKRHARDSNPVRLEEQATIPSCGKCGKTFSEPIELTIQAESSPETYHACPHCFSRVNVSDNSEKRSSMAPQSASTKGVNETTNDVEKTRPVGCENFLGYLKTRPEDSPIPDECLACISVMLCMGLAIPVQR